MHTYSARCYSNTVCRFLYVGYWRYRRFLLPTKGLFFLAEFLAWFIFLLFLFNVERKKRKMNRARSLAKKNRPKCFIRHILRCIRSFSFFQYIYTVSYNPLLSLSFSLRFLSFFFLIFSMYNSIF